MRTKSAVRPFVDGGICLGLVALACALGCDPRTDGRGGAGGIGLPGEDIPRPDFWCGYIVVPHRIEFWSGLPARLHERDVYELTDGRWTQQMLYP